MIAYLVQLSTIWTILLFAFYAFYKNQSYHQFNRWYIILSIIAGIIIPVIPFGLIYQKLFFLAPAFQFIKVFDEITVTATQQVSISRTDYAGVFILSIYIFLVFYKLFQAIKEYAHYYKLTKHKQAIANNVFIRYTDQTEQPFSFIKTIVLPKFLEKETKTKEIIIAHELKHINCRHYNDLVFLKIFEILFPYNPCLYFFKKELLLIHEFQADQAAVKHSNEEDYSNILLQFAHTSKPKGSIIHTFYFSPIKSRLMMLFKKSSRMQYLYLAFIPFLFVACTLVNQDADKETADNSGKNEHFDTEVKIPLPPIVKGDSTITNSNAVMGDSPFLPGFPGGEAALMEFLGKNIQYPVNGKKNGIEGTSYVKFEVFEDGSIRNIEIEKSLGEEFDKELFRVIDLMPKWLPSIKDGKKVKATYTLPVKFKLAN